MTMIYVYGGYWLIRFKVIVRDKILVFGVQLFSCQAFRRLYMFIVYILWSRKLRIKYHVYTQNKQGYRGKLWWDWFHALTHGWQEESRNDTAAWLPTLFPRCEHQLSMSQHQQREWFTVSRVNTFNSNTMIEDDNLITAGNWKSTQTTTGSPANCKTIKRIDSQANVATIWGLVQDKSW